MIGIGIRRLARVERQVSAHKVASRPYPVVREGRLSGSLGAGSRNGERAVPAGSRLLEHVPPLQSRFATRWSPCRCHAYTDS